MTTTLLQPTDTAPPNPIAGLLRSRKFLLMVLDVIASTILYFASQYAGANLDNIKFLIAAYQPVIIWVINSITVEDKARTEANADIAVAQHQANADVAVAMATPATPFLAADHEPFNRTNEPLRQPDRPIAPR